MKLVPTKTEPNQQASRLARFARIAIAAIVFVTTAYVHVDDSNAQRGRRGPRRGDDSRSTQTKKVGLDPEIVWYGSLNDGLKVAKETQRPIFLLSAAPQCTGVPGVW